MDKKVMLFNINLPICLELCLQVFPEFCHLSVYDTCYIDDVGCHNIISILDVLTVGKHLFEYYSLLKGRVNNFFYF